MVPTPSLVLPSHSLWLFPPPLPLTSEHSQLPPYSSPLLYLPSFPWVILPRAAGIICMPVSLKHVECCTQGTDLFPKIQTHLSPAYSTSPCDVCLTDLHAQHKLSSTDLPSTPPTLLYLQASSSQSDGTLIPPRPRAKSLESSLIPLLLTIIQSNS